MANKQQSYSLLSIDDFHIKNEESRKATILQRISPFLSAIFFIFALYLWYLWGNHYTYISLWYLARVGDYVSGWYGTIALIVALVFAGIGSIPETKAKEKIQEAKQFNVERLLAGREGFNYTQKYVEPNFECVVAVDEATNKFCMIDSETRLFTFKDLLAVEIVEDGVQVTRTSRGSQVGGALLGGFLAGGVGAVIGGLSGNKTTSNDKIKRIYLKVIVNDTKRPYVTINFLNEKNELYKKDKKVIEAMNNANHWYSLISVMIKRADEMDGQTQNETTLQTEQSYPSVADELIKLADLLRQDLITKEEFESQKLKLLAKS